DPGSPTTSIKYPPSLAVEHEFARLKSEWANGSLAGPSHRARAPARRSDDPRQAVVCPRASASRATRGIGRILRAFHGAKRNALRWVHTGRMGRLFAILAADTALQLVGASAVEAANPARVWVRELCG